APAAAPVSESNRSGSRLFATFPRLQETTTGITAVRVKAIFIFPVVNNRLLAKGNRGQAVTGPGILPGAKGDIEVGHIEAGLFITPGIAANGRVGIIEDTL